MLLPSSSTSSFLVPTLCIIIGNLLLLNSVRVNWRYSSTHPDTRLQYDYAEQLPDVIDHAQVQFGVDDYFNVNSTSPVSSGDWSTSLHIPGGLFVRQGSEKRLLEISMLHQLHCVNYFRKALLEPLKNEVVEHVQHCLFYLQLLSLCEADTTLEPGDFLDPGDNTAAVLGGYTRGCRKWDQLWGIAKRSGAEFLQRVKDEG